MVVAEVLGWIRSVIRIKQEEKTQRLQQDIRIYWNLQTGNPGTARWTRLCTALMDREETACWGSFSEGLQVGLYTTKYTILSKSIPIYSDFFTLYCKKNTFASIWSQPFHLIQFFLTHSCISCNYLFLFYIINFILYWKGEQTFFFFSVKGQKLNISGFAVHISVTTIQFSNCNTEATL